MPKVRKIVIEKIIPDAVDQSIWHRAIRYARRKLVEAIENYELTVPLTQAEMYSIAKKYKDPKKLTEVLEEKQFRRML